MNPTAQFLGDASTWSQARLRSDDVHGLWGGRITSISGSGEVVLSRFPVPQSERRYEFRLTPQEARQLFELCLQHDLLSITFPPRSSYVPDEMHHTIILTNAAGQNHSVTCWAHDPRHPDFEAIYAALLELENRAASMPPVYEGKATWMEAKVVPPSAA